MPFDGAGQPIAAASSDHRLGLKVDDLVAVARAELSELDRPTVVALMADVGHFTRLAHERRYVLSDNARAWGVGRNVRPKRGHVFPVIYPEHVPMVLRSLAWPWIKDRARSFADDRGRRAFLVRHYSHLPVNTLVHLSGSKKRTVELDLAKMRKTTPESIADLRI
jgi:hypothetical protein